MRFACIDIGTVTARLALVSSKEGRLLSVEKNSVIVNLGEGLAQTGALDAVAVERWAGARFDGALGRAACGQADSACGTPA